MFHDPTSWRDVPLHLTLAEAAEVARESRQTLWRRVRAGKLQATQHGRTIFVSREALMAYCGVPMKDEDPTLADEANANFTREPSREGSLHVR